MDNINKHQPLNMTFYKFAVQKHPSESVNNKDDIYTREYEVLNTNTYSIKRKEVRGDSNHHARVSTLRQYADDPCELLLLSNPDNVWHVPHNKILKIAPSNHATGAGRDL